MRVPPYVNQVNNTARCCQKPTGFSEEQPRAFEPAQELRRDEDLLLTESAEPLLGLAVFHWIQAELLQRLVVLVHILLP